MEPRLPLASAFSGAPSVRGQEGFDPRHRESSGNVTLVKDTVFKCDICGEGLPEVYNVQA